MTNIRIPIPPNQDLLQTWLQAHLTLLESERREELVQSRLVLSKTPSKILESAGLALFRLSVSNVRIGLGAKLLVELERPSAFHSSPLFPSHTFRPGDLAQIQDHDDANKKCVQGVVFRVGDTRIVIAVGDRKKGRRLDQGEKSDKRNAKTGEDNKLSTDELELPERVSVVKVANEATFDRMERALAKLAQLLGVQTKVPSTTADESDSESEPSPNSSAGGASPLIQALMGLQVPSWEQPLADLPLPCFNTCLNTSQLSAIRFALSSHHFALLHGPPGTGKTTAIVELILQLAIGHNLRVLVCGASNLSVDNLLERLVGKPEHREALKKKGAGVTRLGHPARVLAGLHACTLDAQATLSSEGQLVQDVAKEMEEAMAALCPPSTTAGNKSTRSQPRLKGAERRKRWEQVRQLRKEYRKRERGVTTAVLDRAQIVVATCHGAGGKQLNGREFDVVIIDEVCQAVEAACWIPLLKAKREGGRVILAGDHLQLPPTVKSVKVQQKRRETSKKKDVKKQAKDEPRNEEEAITMFVDTLLKSTALRPPRSLETTLFSRLLGLYGPGIKSLLSVQYRMNNSIMSYPNMALYQDKLTAHSSCSDITLSDLGVTDYLLTAPVVFYDTAGTEMYERSEGSSLCNANEAELIIRHIALLVSQGVSVEQIAVLAPYSAQVSLLSSLLRETNFSTKSGSKLSGETIQVGTVDGMQGREKDCVLLTLVRSNSTHTVGFLAEKRRLNVAMTRAKRHLVVVGDSETVAESGEDYLSKWMEWLEDNAHVEMVVTLD